MNYSPFSDIFSNINENLKIDPIIIVFGVNSLKFLGSASGQIKFFDCLADTQICETMDYTNAKVIF